jgi:hypothetical protein
MMTVTHEKGGVATPPSHPTAKVSAARNSHNGDDSASPLYEIRFGGNIWRIEPTYHNGNARLSLWPYYSHNDGSMRPGRGGLQIPLDSVPDFMDAIIKAAKQLGVLDS